MTLTDVGFLLYWAITATHALPPRWLFKGYDDPVIEAWNWSFLPLDLALSATGLGALWAARRGVGRAAASLTLASLVLTSTSGLMAVAFWTLRRDFDPTWWAPNLFLLVWPLFFVRDVAVVAPYESEPLADG